VAGDNLIPKNKMDLQNEIARIAKETGQAEAEIKAQLDTFKQQGYSDQAAVAVLKSQPTVKNRLGGKIIDNALIVPFSKDTPRDVTTKRGPAKVANVSVFVKDAGKWSAAQISLWDDAIDASLAKFEVGKPVKATIRAKEGSDRITVLGDIKPDATPVKPLGELAEQVGLLKLSQIASVVGNDCFVNGIIGRTFTTQYGGGIEISDVGSNPITVYVEDLGTMKVGDEVVVAGRVLEKNGAITIRGTIL